MSIQFAGGTIVNDLFTQTTGTKAELIDQIKADLVTAGWTATGSSGAWTLNSKVTPAGLSCQFVTDVAATNCGRIKIGNQAGSKIQAGGEFLLPAAAKQWRIIANQYHCWVWTPGISAAREFFCGGTIYTPSFTGINEAIFGGGNAQSDTDVSTRASFRTHGTFADGQNNPGNCIGLTNGTLLDLNANPTSNGAGPPTLCTIYTVSQNNGGGGTQPYRWFDGSYPATEALIAWGTGQSTEAKIMGQLWDAMCLPGDFSTDQQITYQGHNFLAVNFAATANNGQYSKITCFVAIS